MSRIQYVDTHQGIPAYVGMSLSLSPDMSRMSLIIIDRAVWVSGVGFYGRIILGELFWESYSESLGQFTSHHPNTILLRELKLGSPVLTRL